MILKEVSKAKHRILEQYFPTWATILGSHYHHLVYVDCFAGEGKYEHNEPGSPLITLRAAKMLKRMKGITTTLYYIEKDKSAADDLARNLQSEPDCGEGLKYYVFPENAKEFVPSLLKSIPHDLPAFFFIDPCGHPISFPIIRQILSRPRTEVLLNLMWYSINRDLGNPQSRELINTMFGHSEWQKQLFMSMHGGAREMAFLKYVLKEIGAQFPMEFRIRFSPEDDVSSKLTKYYLIHFSNHPRAALIMKSIMYNLGDEEGTFDYSATHQGVLFSSIHKESELIEYLKKNYCGQDKQVTFEQLQIETLRLPFIKTPVEYPDSSTTGMKTGCPKGNKRYRIWG
ncbi:MAG TPA: three-Cys-motif partner protein TcmP [Thermodesulfobacteriota bacterium]|nr:three-Cys-motif partner protein TcmP [Thermodesulfobacteriota bacterium]